MIDKIATIPATAGVVEVIKRTEVIPDRFIPLLSLAVGILIELLLHSYSPEMILSGVVTGLSASGLYAGVVKRTIKNE